MDLLSLAVVAGAFGVSKIVNSNAERIVDAIDRHLVDRPQHGDKTARLVVQFDILEKQEPRPESIDR